MEGTVLGTLVMPYCSGLGNLIFAYVLGKNGGNSREVMTELARQQRDEYDAAHWVAGDLVGIIGRALGKSRGEEEDEGRRDATHQSPFAPAHDGRRCSSSPARRGRSDGMAALISLTASCWFGLFAFWQTFHVFDVLKNNVRQNRGWSFSFAIDVILLLAGAYVVYVSTDWLVKWVSSIQSGFISAKHLGWLSGWLMVLPNALLALYYGWKRQAEVVYTSQVGDGHICIPLCIGVFALFRPIPTPEFFQLGVLLLVGAVAVHFLFIALFGRLPRFMGWLLVASYGVFLYKGFAA
jgi:cation:H+ antiporter